jgi:2-C-methyl-D-erythritol 4-phosphate cytidylyltransferase/2-C-methyl-D-erythritol 2,4-cyclodiphosphate synthase
MTGPEGKSRGTGTRAAGSDRDASGNGTRVRPAIEAVVVAAGSSSRMEGEDKLDAVLAGRSVLRRSIEALAEAGVERMVIVTSPSRIAELAAEAWLPDAVVAIVAGGERRQDSVAAGVAALAEAADPLTDPVILVHDAARPLATPELIRAVAQATLAHGAAIPVLPVTETLKRLAGDMVFETVDRTGVVAAQTPQGVRRSVLERAYAIYPADGAEIWTDEASLLEACTISVHVIPGEASNLKVTVPADLDRARVILDRSRQPDLPPARVGLGVDSHPFGPGDSLVLGGVLIEGAPKLVGHSDGDVALHAVADALLGAMGMGDLGRAFPADSRTPAGMDSRIMLKAVADRVRAAGWRPANVDVTIVAARPHLAELLPLMGRSIAEAIGVDALAVNVKASTGNLIGPDGMGRSVSASAVVMVVREDRDPLASVGVEVDS